MDDARTILEEEYKRNSNYQRGYHEGLQKGLEELVKQKLLDVSPIYFCCNCGKELKIGKGKF